MEQTAAAVEESGDPPPYGDARDLWRAISSLTSATVLQVRLDGTIFFISRPPHSLPADDFIGRNIVDMLEPTLRHKARAWLERLTPSDSARRRLLLTQLPDGTRRWFETVGVPVVRNGSVVALTIAARDIALPSRLPTTETHPSAPSAAAPVTRTQDELQRLHLVALIAVGLVHDFNNVLAVIGSATSMLLESVAPGHALRSDLESIQTAIQHGSSLTKHLLELSRHRQTQRTRIELNDVVEDVARMARLFLPGQVRLITQLEPSGAPVVVNRGEIEQVLLNLLLNARDAMPCEGTIVISTCRLNYTTATAPVGCKLRGPVVRLRVKDTGTGIDDVTRSHIFEPFFTTKSERGTGLGLPTVAAIVKESGGCVELASHVGAGTAIDVVLADADRVERCVA